MTGQNHLEIRYSRSTKVFESGSIEFVGFSDESKSFLRETFRTLSSFKAYDQLSKTRSHRFWLILIILMNFLGIWMLVFKSDLTLSLGYPENDSEVRRFSNPFKHSGDDETNSDDQYYKNSTADGDVSSQYTIGGDSNNNTSSQVDENIETDGKKHSNVTESNGYEDNGNGIHKDYKDQNIQNIPDLDNSTSNEENNHQENSSQNSSDSDKQDQNSETSGSTNEEEEIKDNSVDDSVKNNQNNDNENDNHIADDLPRSSNFSNWVIDRNKINHSPKEDPSNEKPSESEEITNPKEQNLDSQYQRSDEDAKSIEGWESNTPDGERLLVATEQKTKVIPPTPVWLLLFLFSSIISFFMIFDQLLLRQTHKDLIEFEQRKISLAEQKVKTLKIISQHIRFGILGIFTCFEVYDFSFSVLLNDDSQNSVPIIINDDVEKRSFEQEEPETNNIEQI